jgi:V8-like Glu-specific endopeptidase
MGLGVDEDAILEAIRNHSVEAAEALLAIQMGLGGDKPLTADSIGAAADLLHRDRAELWLEQLVDAGLVTAFVSALSARGVDVGDEALADPDGDIPFDALEAFLPRARAFRCRVLKNGKVAGSGVLVGPSLVLTSWHVIAVSAPGQPQEPAPDLSVVLSDDSKQKAKVPAEFESECGDAEYDRVAPKNDADVVDRNDVALLAMERPAAAHLGYAPLGMQAPVPRSRSRVVLIHYPEGQDRGIDFGLTRKIRNVTARWRHDVPTQSGSSGGACFNKELQLVGIHQGEFDNAARFVPLERFFEPVFACVTKDVAPTTLWSLDATVTGSLVVGRGLFFEAVSSAGEAGVRVRGVRIKRRRIDAGSVGLAFSYDMLEQLMARRGPSHRLVRVTQDEIVPDLVAEIRRRCRLNGLALPEAESEPGVAEGQAPPETTAKDRGAVLAAAVEAIAADSDVTVWFFFDNPSVALSESARLALEGFIDAALVQPHVRLVIAGFETLPLPGLEFATASPPEGDRSPGLVVEFVGGFRRADILDLLTLASQDLTGGVDMAAMNQAVDRALVGLEDFNNLYADEDLATVSERLRLDLELLREQGDGG